MISPKQYARWSPQLGKMAENAIEGAKKGKARRAAREADLKKKMAAQDKFAEGYEKRAKARAAEKQQPSYPHVSPGEQGTLFDMEPTEPKEKTPSSTADINVYAQALHEKLQREGKLPLGKGTPLGRQVESFSARPSLPKAEGSQGTLFAPRRYRSV